MKTAGAGFGVPNPGPRAAGGMDPEVPRPPAATASPSGAAAWTPRALPFGTPDDVRRQVRERIRIFGPGGGFIFNPTHNVQAQIPVENLAAMYETLAECREYSHAD